MEASKGSPRKIPSLHPPDLHSLPRLLALPSRLTPLFATLTENRWGGTPFSPKFLRLDSRHRGGPASLFATHGHRVFRSGYTNDTCDPSGKRGYVFDPYLERVFDIDVFIYPF
jgi:hypothetical protein